MKFVNNWFLLSIIIILILGIVLFHSIPVIDRGNDISLILSFVGILATFVVIGNYFQVKEIEEKFDKKTRNLEEQNKDILNNSIARSTLTTARIYRDSKDIKLAFYYYQQTIIYCSEIATNDINFDNRVLYEMWLLLKNEDNSEIEPFVTLINKTEYKQFINALDKLKSRDYINMDYINKIKSFANKVFNKSFTNA